MAIDLDDDHIDELRDAPGVRVIETKRNKFTAERRDPYGFWFIKVEKGRLPTHLAGSFTDWEYAKQRILEYCNMTHKVIEEEVKKRKEAKNGEATDTQSN